MADDIKKGFPIKSGGYFPRRYLIPRHRAQTLYSVPYKSNEVANPEIKQASTRQNTSPPLRLRVEQLINQEAPEAYNQTQESLVALATTGIAGNKS